MTSVVSRPRSVPWWSQPWRGSDAANAWVLPLAGLVIAAQLVYRWWASFHSYWEGDDFIFILQTYGSGGRSLDTLLTGLAGHVMPGGLYLSWLVNRISPYDYGLAALTLTALQAVASVGFLRLLVVAFGRRWGILPPLVLYVSSALTVQGAVWWGPGIHALPFQIAFFWGLSSQITYLRTRRARHALAATAWVLFGLLFYEKSILIIGALAIVTVAYFTVGSARERAVQLWTTYRVSLLVNAALGVAYLLVYARFGLAFSPGNATTYPIGPTADVMVLRSWGTGIFGGPLRWSHTPGSPLSFASPISPLVVVCWALFVLMCRELVRSRARSLRALCLPGFFLACDVLLVVAGRANLIGPVIGYEFRYIEEMAAVTAAALAFATMPIRGALEPVEVKRPSALLDRKRPAAVACLMVAALGTFSSFGYFHTWHTDQPNKQFFAALFRDAQQVPPGVAVVDAPVPETVLAPFARPYNTLSQVLLPLKHHPHFATAGTDELLYPASDGHLGKLTVTPERHAQPVTGSRCAYRVGAGMKEIPLDGPILFGGWWVRVGYIATADSSVTVSAGGLTQRASVSSGLHTLYFEAGDERFDSIRIGRLIGGARLCTADVTVGRPVAFPVPDSAR